MDKIIYITLEQAKATHALTIKNSGGGLLEALNLGQLDSVLVHIQNDDYYPTFVDKLTHLFHSVCMFHTYEDGNKRLALSLSTQFLLLNGYLFIASTFIQDYENISYHVASGRISKELLHEILQSSFDGTFDTETIKLKIFDAINS